MIDRLFNNYPMEFGIKRVKVHTKDDLYNLINRWNGKLDCYCSLYGNEDNLVIDKIYFDLDSLQCWENAKRIHKSLLASNIKHYIQFTGGGFGVFIFTDGGKALRNPKAALENAQRGLAKILVLSIGKPNEADIDEHVIGDVRRITRIPYTFNVKENRRRFCIPITEYDFKLKYEEIRIMAETQRFMEPQHCIFGDKLFDLDTYDREPDIHHIDYDESEIDFSTMETDLKLLKGKIPPLILRLLQEKKCGWKDRYYTILAFREAGFPMPLCIEYCKEHWLTEKFSHCMRDEHDFQNIYSNPKIFFPTWDFLEQHGYQVSDEDRKFSFYKKGR